MKRFILFLAAVVLIFSIPFQIQAQEKAAPEEIIDMTRKAASFLSQTREAELEEFNDPGGRWVWKDTYIFAYNCDKSAIAAHPVNPKLIVKKLMGLKDVKGNLFLVQLYEAAENQRHAPGDRYAVSGGRRRL